MKFPYECLGKFLKSEHLRHLGHNCKFEGFAGGAATTNVEGNASVAALGFKLHTDRHTGADAASETEWHSVERVAYLAYFSIG